MRPLAADESQEIQRSPDETPAQIEEPSPDEASIQAEEPKPDEIPAQSEESSPNEASNSKQPAGTTNTLAARLPVNVPGFTGPMDLLVHLIAKHEMDIFTISIASITDEFLNQVREWKEKDLDLAGEYLVLAALLVRYKTRALLPREEIEEEEEEISDRLLEERRQEYERFRALADELRAREEESAALFSRVGPSPEGARNVVEYTEVSVYDLASTFQRILEEIGTAEGRVITGESYSVDEKMLEIAALIIHNERISLYSYLTTLKAKLEVIVVFLALLEMIRLHEVKAYQDQNHGEIFLEKGENLKTSSEENTADEEESADEELE